MYIFCKNVGVKIENCLLEQYIYRKSLAHTVLKNKHEITYCVHLDSMNPAARNLVEDELKKLCARCTYARELVKEKTKQCVLQRTI